VSVNSDEVAEGILKAVGVLALPVVFGYGVYFIVTHPSLLLGLTALAGLAAIVWVAVLVWSGVKDAMARESPSTSHKVGRLLWRSGLAVLLVGGGALYFGSWAWWGVLGGLSVMVVGTAVKSQAQQQQLRRWGRKLPRGNDFYFEMQLQQREEQQRRDR
jgi:hypothetical protein